MENDRRKVLLISEATHQSIKEYCKKHGFIFHDYADKVLREHIESIQP